VDFLTVSARDYCESVGKKLSDYKMVGIVEYKMMEGIKNSLPAKTEVVVAYRESPTGYDDGYGTALIPK